MISLSEFKKLLGDYGKNLTDQQIEEIRNEQYKVAEMAFKVWMREKGLDKLKRSPVMSYNDNTDER